MSQLPSTKSAALNYATVACVGMPVVVGVIIVGIIIKENFWS